MTADTDYKWTLWTYRAVPDPRSDYTQGVVDGDTLDLLLDLGLSTYGRERVRLNGIDTAEKWGESKDSEEYQDGLKQQAFVEKWLAETRNEYGTWPLLVRTRKDRTGKFGRLLATVTDQMANEVLNELLAEQWPEVAV